MRLFIAEKPSLGRAIADVLPGPVRKENGYLVTKGGIVTWCFGHILEAAKPEEYDPRWKAWPGVPRDLPILPKTWKLSPVPKTGAQLAVIRKLVQEASEIVHAGDPDREGQLLVDEVLEYLGNRKPVLRIWLSALDAKSVREALLRLESNEMFKGMRESARARSRADWLVGMNFSRAYTISARSNGNPVAVLSLGRVQTPTLKLVVDRDREIEAFVPSNYFTVKAILKHPNGSFKAEWIPGDSTPDRDPEGRCLSHEFARNVADQAKGQSGQVELRSRDISEPPPLPFSLSTLQMEASRKFGYSAQEVLDIAQSLYEKKLTTYPRTDCEYLPENQLSDSGRILQSLNLDKALGKAARKADPGLKSRAWNTEKVTAHHGIIPTGERKPILPDRENRIYDLIARRYIAQFHPPFKFRETEVHLPPGHEFFRSKGRTIISDGWRSAYDNDRNTDTEEESNELSLPSMSTGDTVVCTEANIEAKQTQPPKPYTDGTLIAAMKNVHRTVTDPGLKKILNESDGLGTEATRAGIIETLIRREFLEKSKKTIRSTPKGRALIRAISPDVASPGMTALWERHLASVEKGQDPDAFMKGISNWIVKETAAALNRKVIIPLDGKPCAKCSGTLIRRIGKRGPFLGCSNYPDCHHMESLPSSQGSRYRTGKPAGFRTQSKGSQGPRRKSVR